MKIAVRYSARYQYEEIASFSPHLARIFPRHDISVHCDRIAFSSDATADVQYRQDLFDNLIGRCFFPEPLELLPFKLELDITLDKKNPFHFLLDSHALKVPFGYHPLELRVLSPYLIRSEPCPLPGPLSRPTTPQDTVEALTTMNSWLHENITYEVREEGEAYPPSETLRRQRASCRDYAVLFADVLREQGVAARLASGFLWEDDSPDSPRRAENAMHAWVEAYLPGAGWLGFDPTNGVLCDHHFLVTAVGITPQDISPVAGHYYGNKTIASTLETALSITEIT
jgi:transglutaminase-like putative cysteine protease